MEKLWMNLRWKIKKVMKSGAATIRVGAVSRDHWAPILPSWVNRTNPAISGLLFSLLVIIKGQRNSFQCQVAEERQKAINEGIEGGK
jgi:hypothetical protein